MHISRTVAVVRKPVRVRLFVFGNNYLKHLISRPRAFAVSLLSKQLVRRGSAAHILLTLIACMLHADVAESLTRRDTEHRISVRRDRRRTVRSVSTRVRSAQSAFPHQFMLLLLLCDCITVRDRTSRTRRSSVLLSTSEKQVKVKKLKTSEKKRFRLCEVKFHYVSFLLTEWWMSPRISHEYPIQKNLIELLDYEV